MTLAETYLQNRTSVLWVADNVIKSFHEDGESVVFFKDGSVVHDECIVTAYPTCQAWLDKIQSINNMRR